MINNDKIRYFFICIAILFFISAFFLPGVIIVPLKIILFSSGDVLNFGMGTEFYMFGMIAFLLLGLASILLIFKKWMLRLIAIFLCLISVTFLILSVDEYFYMQKDGFTMNEFSSLGKHSFIPWDQIEEIQYVYKANENSPLRIQLNLVDGSTYKIPFNGFSANMKNMLRDYVAPHGGKLVDVDEE
ncbi:hypothetical protein NST63_17120 [Heyndrickxia sp. FSL W8-0496]|uniref:hypothetical protein n=1 Tax=Heyndrickxia TaxID=2837504 RepID=UPI0030FC6D73